MERFLRYVSVDTQSDPQSETFPSTAKQLTLLNPLLEEMLALGLSDAEIDPHGYVTGTAPATPGHEEKPVIGLISRMWTRALTWREPERNFAISAGITTAMTFG
ncbi:MAG: hypothetical protein ACLR8Y_02445 [Alistipes indistinctus]